MTDFKRLIDEVDSDLARAVLSSGRASIGNSARKKQVLTALGVGLVIGTTNKISMAALSTWQKVMFIGGVACVGAGGAMTYGQLTAGSSTQSTPVVQAAPFVVVQGAGAPVVEVPAQNEPVNEPAIVAIAPSPQSASIAQSTPRSYERVARESSVKAELGLLEQARASLTSGSAGGALQVLTRYNERYPRGSMRLEAEVLKVEALAASGRTGEASRLADRLLVRNPKSVVASRLRRFASKD
jgi:TolA-binding protein